MHYKNIFSISSIDNISAGRTARRTEILFPLSAFYFFVKFPEGTFGTVLTISGTIVGTWLLLGCNSAVALFFS